MKSLINICSFEHLANIYEVFNEHLMLRKQSKKTLNYKTILGNIGKQEEKIAWRFPVQVPPSPLFPSQKIACISWINFTSRRKRHFTVGTNPKFLWQGRPHPIVYGAKTERSSFHDRRRHPLGCPSQHCPPSQFICLSATQFHTNNLGQRGLAGGSTRHLASL